MKMHRIRVSTLVAGTLILLFLASCTGNTIVLPDWLPEAAAEQAPVSWTADYTAGELSFVTGQTSSLSWKWNGSAVPSMEESSFSVTGSAMTFSQLAGLADAFLHWLPEEDPALLEGDFSLSFAQPDAFYQGNPGGLLSGKRQLVYSIKDSSIRECGSVYNGSQKYGAVTLYFVGGPWQILIDD